MEPFRLPPNKACLSPARSFRCQVLALAGGLSVAIGYKTRWGAWALVAFLVPVTLWMHAYWRLSDPHTVFMEQVLFLKNLSMLGGVLLISQFGAGPLSIDQPHMPR